MSAERDPRGDWRLATLVALVAVVASISGIRNAFTFDDVALIEQNRRIHELRTAEIWSSAYWPPPMAPELYRPLASTLHGFLYMLGGGEPLVFRIASYLLYAASAVAVFALARRVLPAQVALAVGLLFAAHPVHVESVALAVNQGELIVALIAAWCVIGYVDLRRAGALKRRDWLVLAAAYTAAMLTKENAFVIPGLLLAAEFTVLRRESREWRAIAPAFGALALAAACVLAARFAVLSGNVAGALPAEPLVGLRWDQRLVTMLQVVPLWLRLLVWPAHLQSDYSPNEIVRHLSIGPAEWLGIAILLATVAAIVLLRGRMPVVSFGLLWCAVALAPVANVLAPTGIMAAERTLFLPSVGIVIAFGGVLDAMLNAWRAPNLRFALEVICLGLVALGVSRSFRRELVWKNNLRLWLASTVDAPRSLRVQRAHREALDDLTAGYQAVIDKSASPWRERYNLALLLRTMKADSAAVVQLRESLRLRPDQNDVKLELDATLRALAGSGR